MRNNYILLIFLLLWQTGFCQESPDVFDIARRGTLEQAKAAVKANPKAFQVANAEGYSPLILACYRGNNEVVKYIIENGADINASSSMGTALMAAIVKGNNDAAKALLAHGADISISDPNGVTAIIYASMFKNHEIASLLIKAKADPEKKDNRGQSALDYAILADDDKLIEILKSKP